MKSIQIALLAIILGGATGGIVGSALHNEMLFLFGVNTLFIGMILTLFVYANAGNKLLNIFLITSLLLGFIAALPSIHAAPNAPTNPIPADGATNVPCNTSLSVYINDISPPGVPFNVTFYWENGSYIGFDLVPGGQRAYVDVSNLNPNTTYGWYAIVTDWNNEHTSSSVWHFTTAVNESEENHPPSKPTSPNPPNAATGITSPVNLSWSSSDPDNDPIVYYVYFGTNNPPTDCIAAGISKNYTIKYNLEYGETYYWQVAAWDIHNAVNWSNVWRFTVQYAPVASFTYELDGKTVYVNASASYDPDGSIVLYEWDWESDGIYDENHTTPTASHTYEKNGNYTITLRVTDNLGAVNTTTSNENGGGWIIIKDNKNIWKIPFDWFAILAIIMVGVIGIATSAFFLKPESIKALGYAPAAGSLLTTIFIAIAIFIYYAGMAWYWIVAMGGLAVLTLYLTIKSVWSRKKHRRR